ncbi:MAG: glycosyltransferase family 4 protein, partial [Nitrospira sp.]|nr:glycosyltransferase family 4 protein [Nitrospira sp.]
SWPDGLLYLGGRRRGGGLFTNLINRWLDLRNDLRLINILRTGSFDFVQLKDKFLAVIPTILIARWYKIPFFYWLSFPYPEEAQYLAEESQRSTRYYQLLRYCLFNLILYKIALPAASHVFVQSTRMKTTLVLHGIPPEKITPVPMGVSLVDIPQLSPSQNAAAREQDQPCRLVYLGSLSHLRKLGFLLRAFALIQRAAPRTHLFFVGGGNCRDDEHVLKEEADALGLQSLITITGQLPRQEAWTQVLLADVCLSYIPPSPVFDVGSPTKLVEYLALNKVVVANDHPEQREILTQSGAGLCVVSTEQAFAEGVLHLLSHPDEAKRMAERGRPYIAQNRDYPIIAEMLEQEYSTILQRLTISQSSIAQRET